MSTETRSVEQPPPKYHGESTSETVLTSEPVQGTVFHGDGREEALHEHLDSLPGLKVDFILPLKERSQRVLEEIHNFGKGENRYLMSVGDTKGRQVEALIRDKKPKLVLEVGAYVGYSAILFSRHLVDLHPRAKFPNEWTGSDDRAGYISLEKSEVYAKTARRAIELAGLGDVVKIVTGGSTNSLRDLRSRLGMPRPLKFDMVFLDHLKPLYTLDLKLMEEEGLVGPGTVLVADNVVKPGNPAYLSYVRATPSQKRQCLKTPRQKVQPEPTPNPEDSDWICAFRDGPILETRWMPDEAEGVWADGDPDLVYSSSMLDGWDPYTGERDACEVSECLGRA